MTAARYDIEAEQNADFNLELTVRNADGSLRDLTGGTAKLQIRHNPDGTLLHEFTTGGGGITLGGVNGTITIAAVPAVTSAWNWGAALYDLRLVDSGETIRVIEGNFVAARAISY